MASELNTLVFVYGTLKQGFYNFERYLKPATEFKLAEYIADGVTAHPDFRLVLHKQRHFPYLYRSQEGSQTGYSVPGELFRVSEQALKALDVLEGVADGWYNREEVEIKLTTDGAGSEFKSGEVIKAHIYLKAFEPSLLEFESVPSYAAEAHANYKANPGPLDLAILAHIYGSDVATRVQQKVDKGVELDEAWKQVVG